MRKKIVSACLLSLLVTPGLGWADEIEPNFMAGYRMGFFMAVASANPEKICGNVYFQSMNEVIKNYVTTYGQNYPLKHKEVLDLQMKYFPCSQDPAIEKEKN